MCMKEMHYAVHILDPRYTGLYLNEEEKLQYIHKLSKHLPEVDHNAILENIAD